ncbi:MAG: DUF4143 domain-containing protein [Spirochaetaceae bacterium]|nr:DUF4143 domain-containing protein [Spirochaetaceae bacterium]
MMLLSILTRDINDGGCSRYVDLLAMAGLVAGLPKYTGTAAGRRASSPKLNVLNTALMTAGSGYSFEEAVADRTLWGRIAETAVGAHLYNTAASNVRVYYWRQGSHEVDFVLHRGPRLVAIEVKSGGARRGATTALPGIREFERQYGPRRSLLVGQGAYRSMSSSRRPPAIGLTKHESHRPISERHPGATPLARGTREEPWRLDSPRTFQCGRTEFRNG